VIIFVSIMEASRVNCLCRSLWLVCS